MNDYYLSLGSNIDPEENLIRAANLLAEYGNVTATSTIWETAPIGFEDQPNYLNAVVLLQSYLPADEIQHRAITEIEQALNRVRGPNKFGPRTIDIDILLINDEEIELDHRKIPSPEILERAFVAVPLAEIAPQLVHPITKEKMASIASRFTIEDNAMFARRDLSI